MSKNIDNGSLGRLEETLLNMGLNELESKVYLAMLPLGDTSIIKISSRSDVKRTTVYTIIDTLKKKGLVSEKEVGFKKYFFAEDPARLKTIVERKKEELISVLPDLESLYKNKDNSSIVKYYEGLDALKSVYDELLENLKYNDDYFVYGDPERWDSHAQDYFKSFIKRRLRIQLNVKNLLTNSQTAVEYKRFEKNFNEEVRLLPENYSLDVNVVITDKKIIIHKLTNPIITIVIEDKPLINFQKNLFLMMWNFCDLSKKPFNI